MRGETLAEGESLAIDRIERALQWARFFCARRLPESAHSFRSSTKAASSRTVRPSSWAFVSFEPGSSPATT